MQVIDPSQLVRIEAVHRGFLYQHLYAVACLLDAATMGATSVTVESDEDIEVEFPAKRLYIQIKTRKGPLIYSDISDVLARFKAIEDEHQKGRRHGDASFSIISNSAPGPDLLDRLASSSWPKKVALLWPGGPQTSGTTLPVPSPDVDQAFVECARRAAALPFAILTPDTLVWKLAGCVMAAAAGANPHPDHTFDVKDLSELFEQLVVQLQGFPVPPSPYRSQDHEPDLFSDQRVRLIVGFSGAGKTSWASYKAMHTPDFPVYFNGNDTPSSMLLSGLAREVAATLYGKAGGKLGDIILPGRSGKEILYALDQRLKREGRSTTVVLDNAHVIPVDDIKKIIETTQHMSLVLLAQPAELISQLEAVLTIRAEQLRGWTNETVAAEGAALQCRGDYAVYDRLLKLTGGLPLYIRSALRISAETCDGDVGRFCHKLETQTHATETAQELILERVFGGYSEPDRHAIGVLSLCDCPLNQEEVSTLLKTVLKLEPSAVAALLRRVRRTGVMQIFGVNQFKIHDAMRVLGNAYLQALGSEAVRKAQEALRDYLINSLPVTWHVQRVFLLLRVFVSLNEIKPLVELATDELFHEMGFMNEIVAFLEAAAVSELTLPEDRFWALDGLVFADFKSGRKDRLEERLATMKRLIADHDLGASERLAVGMKAMLFAAGQKDSHAVSTAMDEISEMLPDDPEYIRIARYNYAHALRELGLLEQCLQQTSLLIDEYYDLLGLTPDQVVGKNPDKLRPIMKKTESFQEDVKHLADTLDLHAIALNGINKHSGLARIHAIKFYEMANAVDSLVRVSQDMVDEFISRRDYIGARQMIESNLLPNIEGLKLADRIIPVRAQYAVVLAYCGELRAADAEMARLAVYEAGLDEAGQQELRAQRQLIAQIKLQPPPPQWHFQLPPGKYPVNAPCPCGSGKKFKKCHGSRASS